MWRFTPRGSGDVDIARAGPVPDVGRSSPLTIRSVVDLAGSVGSEQAVDLAPGATRN
jgi:hypothetical protein